MKKITSLNDLLMEELADLLSVENQLVKALPKMAQASQSLELKRILEDHLEVTKRQIYRLQDIFSNTGQNPKRIDCKIMKGLIREVEHVIKYSVDDSERDTAITGIFQRIKHYELTDYATAREHAENLGHTRIIELLDKTLNEERAVNLQLNELAQGLINVQAIDPKGYQQSRGFYLPQGRFGRKGIKKKPKGTDVSRFIDEGNPNSQDWPEKEEKKP